MDGALAAKRGLKPLGVYRGLAVAAAADRPGKVKIRHQGSNEEYELALRKVALGVLA